MTASERAVDICLRIGVLGVVFGVWWMLTRSSDSIFFPTPTDVLPAAWNDWLVDGETWTKNILPSVRRLLYGFFMSAAASITLGLALGRNRRFSEFIEPLIHFGRAVPPPALLPLLLIVLGIGDVQKVTLIALGVAPPILLNSIEGARSVETLQLDTAAAYQVSRWDRWTRVIFPAASPKVFAGLRVSMSLAVILMVISELVAATDGMGFRINSAARDFAYVDLWAGMVVLALLGIVLNIGLALVERRVLRWNRL